MSEVDGAHEVRPSNAVGRGRQEFLGRFSSAVEEFRAGLESARDAFFMATSRALLEDLVVGGVAHCGDEGMEAHRLFMRAQRVHAEVSRQAAELEGIGKGIEGVGGAE